MQSVSTNMMFALNNALISKRHTLINIPKLKYNSSKLSSMCSMHSIVNRNRSFNTNNQTSLTTPNQEGHQDDYQENYQEGHQDDYPENHQEDYQENYQEGHQAGHQGNHPSLIPTRLRSGRPTRNLQSINMFDPFSLEDNMHDNGNTIFSFHSITTNFDRSNMESIRSFGLNDMPPILAENLLALFTQIHSNANMEDVPTPLDEEKRQKLQHYKYSELTPRLLERESVDNTCSICTMNYENDDKLTLLPCKHYYHDDCINQWLSKFSKKCPICRVNLDDTIDNDDSNKEVNI